MNISKNLNILHVVNVSFVLPYFLGDQLDYFINKGHTIHVACTPSEHLDDYAKLKGFKKVELNISRKFNFLQDITSLLLLIQYIKKNDIDIVIGHTPKGGLLAMIASYYCNVSRRIYFRHGLMFETSIGLKQKLLIFIEKITSKFSTKIVLVSKSVLEKSIALSLNNGSKNYILNNGSCNGVDVINRFNPENIDKDFKLNFKKSFNIGEDDIIIGFVGRIVRDKGINELVESWKKINNEFKNTKLLLIGPLEERDPIQKNILDYIINDVNIIHLGVISNPELYYSIIDIFILPSYREGFPTVVLEASSMQIPVITTRNTGCIDSIQENRTGMFCEITIDSIYQNIKFYIKNPKLRVEHGINGREFVKKNYRQELIWEEIEKLF